MTQHNSPSRILKSDLYFGIRPKKKTDLVIKKKPAPDGFVKKYKQKLPLVTYKKNYFHASNTTPLQSYLLYQRFVEQLKMLNKSVIDYFFSCFVFLSREDDVVQPAAAAAAAFLCECGPDRLQLGLQDDEEEGGG